MSNETSNIPKSLVEALKAGTVIPFVGAGVSLSLKKNKPDRKLQNNLFPSWKEFLFNAADKLDSEKIALDESGKSKQGTIIRTLINLDEKIDYLNLAQRSFDALGGKYWYELLTENFDIDIDLADEKSTALPKLMWRINSNLVITTNVDLVLESVHESPRKVKILDTQFAEFAELQKDWQLAQPTVLHLHGHINDKVNVVFTNKQYREFYDLDKNRAKLETLRRLFTQRTILFIGFSLDDLFIIKELERVNLIYEGRANYLYVLIHENEKNNSNIPPYIQKIIFSDFGEPLVEKVLEILSSANISPVSNLAPPTSTEILKNYFNVPYASKGRAFVGRTGLREKIWESLNNDGRTAIGQAINIKGIGGLGKTQLAVEYAYELQDRYENGVFWLTADKDLDTQLIKIGKDLSWITNESDLGFDQTELVRNRFRKLSNCLIIFDNVEDRNVIENYLPEKGANSHILITSREKQSGFYQLELGLLNRDESRNLLLKIAGRAPQNYNENKAFEGILAELEDLPLAVELVGGYIGENSLFTYARYYRFLLDENINKLEAEFPDDSFTKHDKSIIRTLGISERLLEEKPLLKDILDILSWSGKSFMGYSLLHALVGINDEFTLLNTLSDAINLRLVKKDENSDRYSIHRLLARVRQTEKPLATRKEWHLNIVKRMEVWFRNKNEESKTFSDAEIELDHLKAWQKSTLEYIPSEAIWLIVLESNPLMVRGNYHEAKEYVKRALQLYERENLTDNLLLANLYNALSQPYIFLGKSEKAKSYIEKALDFYNKNIVNDKKLQAELLSNLGSVYDELKNFEEALKLQMQALEIRQKLFSEKHPSIAQSLNKTGYAYGEAGNHQKAIELKQQALEMWQELFGNKHSEIATSLNNLGITYTHVGDYEKALEYKQKALEMREELFDGKHPYIANSLSNVGSTYIQLGNIEEGLKLKDRALEMRRELLGEDHEYTLSTCVTLLKLYIKYNYADKAKVLAARYERHIPIDHSDRKLFGEMSSEYWKEKFPAKKLRH